MPSTLFVNRANFALPHTTNSAIAANTAMLYVAIMRYSTSDLSRKSGDIIARALQAPITITQRGKPRLIMMSVEAVSYTHLTLPTTSRV